MFGVWNGIPNTTVAEILAGAGYDWIVVDGEHGPFDIPSILSQLQAIKSYDVPVIVRPPEGTQLIIRQLMDIGVQTLLVPMVESADQAAQIVSYMRYPPEGIRGVGAGLARAAQWNREDNYLLKANSEMCLIAQIETRKGVENLEEIARVEGVDVLLIGPADLAASIGHLGNPRHPSVVELIHECLKKIRSLGIPSGILASTEEATREYMDAGVQVVGLGADTMLLAQSSESLRQLYS